MKKSDLKTGYLFKEIGDNEWKVCIKNYGKRKEKLYFCFNTGHYSSLSEKGLSIIAEVSTLGNLMSGFVEKIDPEYINGFTVLWEDKPEKTFEIDGVEYSESTLRSIIKKATGKE